MKSKKKTGRILAAVLFFNLCGSVAAAGQESSVVQMIPATVDMTSTEGPGNLYALSAVLMDGDSGRVLYEKEGYVPRPNASTTKVMTCILALENGSGDDYVMVSRNAAAQPEVKLNLKEG